MCSPVIFMFAASLCGQICFSLPIDMLGIDMVGLVVIGMLLSSISLLEMGL